MALNLEGRSVALTFRDVTKIALSLEGVEEGTSYGTPAFKAGGKLLARLKEDGETLVVGTTFEEREALMAEEPGTYFITEHYLNYPWVLVRLSQVSSDVMRDLLKRALRLAAAAPRQPHKQRRSSRSRR